MSFWASGWDVVRYPTVPPVRGARGHDWIIPRKEFWRYLQALMDAGLGKRLMWGSDQMNWPATIDLAIEAVEEAPFLSEEEKTDLFYNNAARFLRLNAPAGG